VVTTDKHNMVDPKYRLKEKNPSCVVGVKSKLIKSDLSSYQALRIVYVINGISGPCRILPDELQSSFTESKEAGG
jgi:hypothetical protein